MLKNEVEKRDQRDDSRGLRRQRSFYLVHKIEHSRQKTIKFERKTLTSQPETVPITLVK